MKERRKQHNQQETTKLTQQYKNVKQKALTETKQRPKKPKYPLVRPTPTFRNFQGDLTDDQGEERKRKKGNNTKQRKKRNKRKKKRRVKKKNQPQRNNTTKKHNRKAQLINPPK